MRKGAAQHHVTSTRIDFLRVNGASAANINKFFDCLNYPRLFKVIEKDIYNVDEISSIISLRDNLFIIGLVAIRKVYTLNPRNRE